MPAPTRAINNGTPEFTQTPFLFVYTLLGVDSVNCRVPMMPSKVNDIHEHSFDPPIVM